VPLHCELEIFTQKSQTLSMTHPLKTEGS
jgi:hypothetical protein